MACSNMSGGMDLLSEVRIVLLGGRTTGKSTAGNTILGKEDFDLRGSAQCVKRQGEVSGRKITVVEAPGWQRNKAIKQVLRQEIVLSVSMCPPGPHAVLLVMRLDCSSWESEKDMLKGCMMLLTERVWSHVILLFTCEEWRRDQTIEEYIACQGKALQWLVKKCGNRYHVFNYENRNNNTQVTELLEKIEKMVAGNSGCHLEIDPKILQDVRWRKEEEERRATVRRIRGSHQKEYIRSHMYLYHLSEVRIVLLGYRNAGKSSSGNTILSTEKFGLDQSDQSVKRQGLVAGRIITVVEAPGWQRNKSWKNITTGLLEEIVLSMSMCPPGPHAVLLIVSLDFAFEEKQRKSLVHYLSLLNVSVWSHTMVLFTFGDSLGDTTIERHIESEGRALQWLVEKCGNRYHVFNNKDRNDNTQVLELLEKIEEMVAVNEGHIWNWTQTY
ncbi:GTPase IMAP family member 8-like [Clarias gariepinus]|uniref:GTPase IMAP family member 8-like n=1 Tax=Clarias gariepinus TaxID=13013 RepID=UPI00234C6D1A|nr:GTPase IMAP family member 8-like [Clarias gariepinus]